MTTKPTNPKDRAATNRLPLDLVPSTMSAYAALAFAEGDAKYYGYNWREAGVMASVYRASTQRHLDAWWNGEDEDPKTGVPHLASALAGIAIILDALTCGKLNDDRPPPAPVGELIRSLEAKVAAIREVVRKDKVTQSWADAANEPRQHQVVQAFPRRATASTQPIPDDDGA